MLLIRHGYRSVNQTGGVSWEIQKAIQRLRNIWKSSIVQMHNFDFQARKLSINIKNQYVR